MWLSPACIYRHIISRGVKGVTRWKDKEFPVPLQVASVFRKVDFRLIEQDMG